MIEWSAHGGAAIKFNTVSSWLRLVAWTKPFKWPMWLQYFSISTHAFDVPRDVCLRFHEDCRPEVVLQIMIMCHFATILKWHWTSVALIVLTSTVFQVLGFLFLFYFLHCVKDNKYYGLVILFLEGQTLNHTRFDITSCTMSDQTTLVPLCFWLIQSNIHAAEVKSSVNWASLLQWSLLEKCQNRVGCRPLLR